MPSESLLALEQPDSAEWAAVRQMWAAVRLILESENKEENHVGAALQ